MPSQITSYKCPNCSGPLHFAGASGKLECEYCGSIFTVEEAQAAASGAEAKADAAFQAAEARRDDAGAWDDTDTGGEWGAEAENLRAYNCPSCGAELICEKETAATACPYCGNPAIVPGQLSGALKPDLVVPFRLDKNAAVAGLKKHYQGKFLLPRSFTDGNHIREIKGVYVPFWLFDGAADAEASYAAERSHTHTEGNYEVTVTEHYQIRRAGSAAFEKVPVDASTKMPDDLMDSIEPYDYRELKDFSTAYLPGYLADRYDVSVQESAPRADERCRNSVLRMLDDTVTGYTSVQRTGESVRLRRGKVRYALMPVWLLSTQWNGQNFLFAMNGQTGKMVGDLPISRGKLLAAFFAIAAPLAALMAWFLR